MEPRYQAVVAVVQDGWKFVEVAEHFGVSPQDHRAKGTVWRALMRPVVSGEGPFELEPRYAGRLGNDLGRPGRADTGESGISPQRSTHTRCRRIVTKSLPSPPNRGILPCHRGWPSHCRS
jgi:hypothetical protein